MVRIIAIADTPEDFSTSVTTANNTQNDLSPVDFVAADENQDRIKREAISFGKIYSYRRGEADVQGEVGFTVREATIASACASGDMRLAVSAKRYISGLWENTTKEPYTKLFNESVSARYLWNIVKVMRIVDDELAIQAKELDGRDRLIAIHANRFILFTIFEEISEDFSQDFPINIEIENKIRETTGRNLAIVIPLVNDLYPDGYAGNVFKNRDKQVQILSDMQAVLAEANE